MSDILISALTVADLLLRLTFERMSLTHTHTLVNHMLRHAPKTWTISIVKIHPVGLFTNIQTTAQINSSITGRVIVNNNMLGLYPAFIECVCSCTFQFMSGPRGGHRNVYVKVLLVEGSLAVSDCAV